MILQDCYVLKQLEALLLALSKDDPEDLRQRVTSKGGTTAAAIQSFDDDGLKSFIAKAMSQAFERSKELS